MELDLISYLTFAKSWQQHS